MVLKKLTFEYVYDEDHDALMAVLLSDKEGPHRLIKALRQYVAFMAANRGSRRDAALNLLEAGALTGDDLLHLVARGLESASDDLASAIISKMMPGAN